MTSFYFFRAFCEFSAHRSSVNLITSVPSRWCKPSQTATVDKPSSFSTPILSAICVSTLFLKTSQECCSTPQWDMWEKAPCVSPGGLEWVTVLSERLLMPFSDEDLRNNMRGCRRVFYLPCLLCSALSILNSSHAEMLLESVEENLWLQRDLELNQKPPKGHRRCVWRPKPL